MKKEKSTCIWSWDQWNRSWKDSRKTGSGSRTV